MIEQMKKIGDRLFPERQILVRSKGQVSCWTISQGLQCTVATSLVALTLTVGYLAVGYVRVGHVARVKVAEIAQVENSNSHLRDALQRLEKQLGLVQATTDLKSTDLALLSDSLDTAHNQLTQSQAQRATLQARLDQLESELKSQSGKFKSNLDTAERKAKDLANERDKALAERERHNAEREKLNGKIVELEAKLKQTLAQAQKAQQQAKNETVAQPAPNQQAQAKTPTSTGKQASSGGWGLGDIEHMLVTAGVDMDKLLDKMSLPPGQGGPFVALGKNGKTGATPSDAERAETLQKLLKVLPLSAPTPHYQFESPFGTRTDPINRKQSYHSGVDLSAPFKSPIYNTAPGTVTFTGVKDAYGRVVEVDHGMGIVTRYAHLHRIMVVRGQKLTAHQQIAQLGSSGRSTGPHVHYEILLNGTAVDPEKFLEAGKSVQVSVK